MVIKGSAAKRDGKRLHPVADVEQEGKKRKEEKEKRESAVCRSKDTQKRK